MLGVASVEMLIALELFALFGYADWRLVCVAVSVIAPILATKPTKFMPALSTSHMIAAPALLDRSQALWTLLRERTQPRDVHAIIRVELQPLPMYRAGRGFMGFLLTTQTEAIVTVSTIH